MAKRKDLRKLRKGRQFVKEAKRRGGTVKRQTGSHAIVQGTNGKCMTIPVHAREMPKGTRFAIIKAFVTVGLALTLLAVPLILFGV